MHFQTTMLKIGVECEMEFMPACFRQMWLYKKPNKFTFI